MDAATAKPGALVEAVDGSARRLEHAEDVEDGPRRRRAAEWQLEEHALAKPKTSEPPHLRGRSQLEGAAARRCGDDHHGALGLAEV
jgi:hypothetical protein